MLINYRNAMMAGKRLPKLPRSYMAVTIPTDGYDFRISFAGSNVEIDWGDGNIGTHSTGTVSHTYNTGNYNIEISDACTRFECPASYGRTVITEVGFGTSVTGIADAGYNGATSLVKIACAPSVSYAVNNTFNNCSSLDWICDFPALNISSNRFSFLPWVERQFAHIGIFSAQKYAGPIYGSVVHGASVDFMNLMPALLDTVPIRYSTMNYYVRRASFPLLTYLGLDAFLTLPNLYGVYCPQCTRVSSCITRNSSAMNNNPLGVTHMRLGHLETGYTPESSRTLCWGGNENYLGVFMVDMTRAELSAWLSSLSVSNFISQSSFTNKAICTNDPEWDEWDEWFSNGMEIEYVPTFPLSR